MPDRSQRPTRDLLARFRPAMHVSPTPMLLLDDARSIVEANRAAVAAFGTPPGGVLGLTLDELVSEPGRRSLDARWTELLNGGWTELPCRLRQPGGGSARADFVATRGVAANQHLLVMFDHDAAQTTAAVDPGTRSPLTAREREVLMLVASGMETQGVADELTIGVETVRTHIRRAVTKLGARNRTQAVALALASGEITLGQ